MKTNMDKHKKINNATDLFSCYSSLINLQEFNFSVDTILDILSKFGYADRGKIKI